MLLTVTYTCGNTESIIADNYYFTNMHRLMDSPLYKSYARHFYYLAEF